MIEIDARGVLEPQLLFDMLLKLRSDQNAAELFWRVGPDVMLTLQLVSSDKQFSDTLYGLPLRVEWDAAPHQIALRDKYSAIGRMFNLPDTKL